MEPRRSYRLHFTRSHPLHAAVVQAVDDGPVGHDHRVCEVRRSRTFWSLVDHQPHDRTEDGTVVFPRADGAVR
jgi:hypothetical protein